MVSNLLILMGYGLTFLLVTYFIFVTKDIFGKPGEI